MSSFIDTAERTVEHTRSSLVDLGAQALRLTNSLRAIEARGVDSLFDHFGLQRRKGALGSAVWFAAGAVAAGAIILLFAPESGKKLRGRVAQLWESRAEKEAEPPTRVAPATPAAPNAQEQVAH